MNAWLTPENAPGDLVEYSLFFPVDQEYKRAFLGALLLLCEAENWQQFGAMTPEDTAVFFSLIFDYFIAQSGWLTDG